MRTIILRTFLLSLLCTIAMGISAQSTSAPAVATGLTTHFEGPSLQGTLTFTLPTTTAGGATLTDETLSYQVYVAYSLQKEGTAKPGATVTEDVQAPYAYTTQFTVYVSNAAGKSEAANLSQWVGYAEPKAPTNVAGTYNAANGSIVLTWDAVTEPMTDGYFQPSDISYIVVRFDEEFNRDTVAQNVKQTTYTDKLPNTDQHTYYYVVTSVNGDVLGYTGMTDNILAGGSYQIPFIDNFDEPSDFDIFTIKDINGDDYTWEYEYYRNCAAYRAGTEAADDWLFTPELAFGTAREYEVRFKASSAMSYLPEQMEVRIGKGVDPAGYTQVLMPVTAIPQDTTITLKVRLATAGDYRVGFHVVSPADQSYLYIDNLAITNGIAYDAPAAVTITSATPGADGSLSATIKGKAPTKTYNGAVLTTSMKIIAYRDGVAVDSVLNVSAGSDFELHDAHALSGTNRYVVLAENEAGSGPQAEATVFVGMGDPMNARNIVLKDNLNGTLTLSWDAPGTEGRNGGYVDPAAVRYNVYTVDHDMHVVNEKIAGGISETSYNINVNQDTTQHVLYYAVSVFTNDSNETDPRTSSPVIVGRPDRLPYLESFAGGHIEHDLLWTEQKGIYAFNVQKTYTADNDGGAAYWYTDSIGEEGWINTGKIKPVDAPNLRLVYSYLSNPAVAMTLKVEVSRNGEPAVVVDEVNMESFSGKEFVDRTVDLSNWRDAEYIIVKFHAIAGSEYNPVLVDNIRIFNAADGDASITASMPAGLKRSQAGKFKANILNMGATTMTGIKAYLVNGTTDIAEQTVDTLKAYERKVVELEYAPTTADGNSLTLHMELAADEDSEPTNNITPDVEIPVEGNSYEAPVLTGTVADESVTLSWNKPETEQETVTDDFEAYDPFVIDNFGPWTCYDGDGGSTYAFDFVQFPNESKPMAFITFDPTVILPDFNNNENLMAHSGNRYIVSFDATAASAPNGNDDWLVSPRLSGRSQQLAFYAKGIVDDYGKEQFEILYSTTDNNVENFRKLGETYTVTSDAWQRIEASLPEDAVYFAIHVISKNCFGLMIDDISYEQANKILAYRVYRDGKFLAETTENSFTDAEAGEEYNVTAVYEHGESDFSNTFNVANGIAAISANALQGNCEIYDLSGRRIQTMQHGVYILKFKDGRVVKVRR